MESTSLADKILNDAWVTEQAVNKEKYGKRVLSIKIHPDVMHELLAECYEVGRVGDRAAYRNGIHYFHDIPLVETLEVERWEVVIGGEP